MTAPPIATLLLDVDGTLLDTREFIFRAYEDTLPRLGLDVPDRDALALQVGRPLEEIYADLAGERAAEAIRLHRAFQVEHLELAEPFPGAVEAVAALHAAGVKLAAVTSRSHVTSIRTLELAGLMPFLGAVVSAEDGGGLKPDPAPLQRALDLLDATPVGAAVAGDTRHDIQAGQALGITTIAATYGFHGDAVLAANPDIIIGHVAELPGAIGLVPRP